MRYLSVCAGIEAATAAWHHLGWKAAAFSEIEQFPRAVLAHHYPDVPLHGDFTTIQEDDYGPIDLLVGGTPCQSFSVAGKRGGMADARGNLALEYILLARRKRARWVVWENVPGVLSSNGGEDFRCFLSGLAGWNVPQPEGGWKNSGVISAGPVYGAYGLAWRILDAQYAGVPQRRRRVFVVGYIGDWRRAAAVLLERHGLQGHSAPRREKGQRVAATLDASLGRISQKDSIEGRVINQTWPAEVAPTLDTHFGDKMGLEDQHIRGGAGLFVPHVAGALCRDTFSGGADGRPEAASAGHFLPVPILEAGARTGISTDDPRAGIGIGKSGDPMFTLQAGKQHAIAFAQNTRDEVRQIGGDGQIVGALAAESGAKQTNYIAFTDEPQPVAIASAVRRLTPRECERLQGFPDDFTLIPYRGKEAAACPDGPRYKALGNSMAVPVMRWIGERIQAVEDLRLNDAEPSQGEAA